jgi:hypothetical protein
MIFLVWIAVVGIPFWKIVGRTGNHPALTLLLIVPLVNLAFLWWLAFGRWPALESERS